MHFPRIKCLENPANFNWIFSTTICKFPEFKSKQEVGVMHTLQNKTKTIAKATTTYSVSKYLAAMQALFCYILVTSSLASYLNMNDILNCNLHLGIC